MTLRRAAAILLLASVGALGTGLFGRLHAAVHPHERAGRLPSTACADGPDHHPHDPEDDSDCRIDLLLKAPVTSFSSVPVLVLVGLFVAFLTLLSQPLVSTRVPSRLDCRGPPAC